MRVEGTGETSSQIVEERIASQRSGIGFWVFCVPFRPHRGGRRRGRVGVTGHFVCVDPLSTPDPRTSSSVNAKGAAWEKEGRESSILAARLHCIGNFYPYQLSFPLSFYSIHLTSSIDISRDYPLRSSYSEGYYIVLPPPFTSLASGMRAYGVGRAYKSSNALTHPPVLRST